MVTPVDRVGHGEGGALESVAIYQVFLLSILLLSFCPLYRAITAITALKAAGRTVCVHLSV